MEQRLSWEAKRFSGSQEILRILWNQEVRYRTHKSPPLVPILRQINPVHVSSSHYLKIHLNIILLLRLGLPSGLFPSGFPTKPTKHLSYPHTCYMPPPTSFLIWSFEHYLVSSTDNYTSRYVVSATSLLPRPT
jgi:hypothetical protein